MSYNAQFVSALKEALNGLRTIHSVGEEWCSYIGQIPTGGVPYCGQEVTRSTYSALWSYAQAQGLVKTESEWQSWSSSHGGNVPYYSSGDGSTTFRMPSIKGYVKGASSQSEAGEYVAEGMPNIVGNIEMSVAGQGLKSTGSFIHEYTYAAAGGLGGGNFANNGDGSAKFDFNASLSNPIYGNSDHVTPETNAVLFGVFAYGSIANVGELDAETLATGLAKVESNLAKVESNLETKIDANSIIPDYTAGVSITVKLQTWTTFDVPCDGIIVPDVTGYMGAKTQLKINGKSMYEIGAGQSFVTNATGQFVVKKGDVVESYVNHVDTTYVSAAMTFYPFGR